MGFIKIYRKIQEWEWYGCPSVLTTWVHLLINANWKDEEWRGIEVPRGSLITSYSNLASETGLSIKQVRGAIDKLEKGNQIVRETANKWTKITICNYDNYQVVAEDEGQAKGRKEGTQRASKRATIEEYKEEQERKNIQKKTSNDVKEKLVFPFSSDLFIQTWNNLVGEDKWRKKSTNALQLSLNKLGKYDERFAIKLMEDAMERGWQGVVFPDTDKQYAEWLAANPPAQNEKVADEEPTLPFDKPSPWQHGVFYTIRDFQATEEGRKALEKFKGGWEENILKEEGGLLRFMTIWEPLSDHPEFIEQNKEKYEVH